MVQYVLNRTQHIATTWLSRGHITCQHCLWLNRRFNLDKIWRHILDIKRML